MNVDVGLQYLSAWLGGNGCVPIYNLMEDAATAEICRAQVWQWLQQGATLDDGRTITAAVVGGIIDEHVEKLSTRIAPAQLFTAARLFEELVTAVDFPEFLTSRAYDHLE